MEELSNTERRIVSYIKSHPPEDCMLDKITRGTSRSRATVLKYLEILHAKGILSYKFVGRSKLWFLKQSIPEPEIIPEFIDLDTQETNELFSAASRLHTLRSKEMELKMLIDSPDTLIFTISMYMDIVAANNAFDTFFPGRRNLREIISTEQINMLENVIRSLRLKDKVTIEINMIEKSGVYRPYKVSMQPISDENESVIGSVIIGEELSQSRRTKRELETLLSIAQAASSARSEEQLMEEATGSIMDIIPYKYCTIFLKDNGNIRSAYETSESTGKLFSHINGFIEKSMDTLETKSAGNGDFYLENVKSLLEDTSLSLMLSIPIIDEDSAIGSILLLTTLTSVSSVNIENVEMAADELSGYLKMQRLTSEKEEFANTLLAMNRISTVLNSTSNEDEILEKAVKSTIDSLGFEMGCIYLNDNEELTLRVHRNLPEGLKNMCMAGMFTDLFSKTLEKKNLVYITSDYEEYNSLDPAIKTNGIRTLLILPIKSGNEIIGLLNMGSRHIKHYNNTSLENLSSIGLQLGLALEKSRLAIKLKAESNQDTDAVKNSKDL
ncbi:GAF domain-containing protein [Methanobacterium sp.]|uniref:GAF domain-containing protein n=1 Tax=Methanobacterium sp. TaxID=2164 RepID=UPI003C777E31